MIRNALRGVRAEWSPLADEADHRLTPDNQGRMEMCKMTYTYAYGYRSYDEAHRAFIAACEDGECSPCELSAIEPYGSPFGTRWKIVLSAE